jgi:uncharacterized protein YjbJ (UPF0337 family)
MSNTSKRVEGAIEQVGGKIKSSLGKVTGNERMEAEGRATELKGQAKQEAAKATERVKGKVEELVGGAKSVAGDVIDDETLEAEGDAQRLKGKGRQEANR